MQADIPIPRAHDLTGTVLGGRYEVLGKLGVGGMAAVYEGRRVGLHNRVAIKVLKPELCEDPGNVKRFLREARAASVIEHDNIVDIIDFGPVDGVPVYFVMEFLEGSDLRRVVKQAGPLLWAQAQPLLLQVVGALAAAHDKGIVHRDVKPANIFIVPRANGETMVKVLDFGIAKVVEEGRGGITRGLTMTNGLLGTVAYMAPEQARGGKIDARTDIYALGIVMYQVLTGSVPYPGNNPFMVLERHVNEAPRAPRDIVNTIPPEAEAIILRCMAKRPDDRFESMTAVAEALLAAQPAAPDINAGPATVDGPPLRPVWSPPMAPPSDERPARVVATEKLGSGGGVTPSLSSMAGAAVSARGGTQPRVDAPPTLPTHPLPDPVESAPPRSTARVPFKAFFVLGFGFGIVAACVIAFLAVAYFDDEPTPTATPPPTPVKEVVATPTPSPPPDAPEPEPKLEDEPDILDPEPAGQTELPVAEPPTRRTKRRHQRRPPPAETKAPAKGKKATRSDPQDDLHPDLRQPY